MTKEQFYANNKEWLEQKAKVVTYTERYEKCKELISKIDGAVPTILLDIRIRYDLALCAARESLRKIERRLDIEFRRKEIEGALCRSARFIDEAESDLMILTKILEDGYIGGIKL